MRPLTVTARLLGDLLQRRVFLTQRDLKSLSRPSPSFIFFLLSATCCGPVGSRCGYPLR